MKRNNYLTNIFLSLVIALSLVTTTFSGCSPKTTAEYVQLAEKSLADDKFDLAKNYYEEAYKLSNDNKYKQKIDAVADLEKSAKAFQNGNELLAKSEFLFAIDSYTSVISCDSKRYSIAQTKIGECKKLYVEKHLPTAKYYVETKQYTYALSELDKILKLDTNNSEAKQLKTNCQDVLYKEALAKSSTVSAPAPTTPYVQPKNDNKEITVYITRTGSKYHRAGCRYLSQSMIAISLSRAKASYSPCSVCNPPR